MYVCKKKSEPSNPITSGSFVQFIRRGHKMSDRKIIAVVGATGAQGGGLIRAIAGDPSGEFAARAITRHPDSEKAKALQRLGVEVVAGDVEDGASLQRAFEGAYGAFCVTFFWEHFSAEKELTQARTQAEAAKKAHLQHVIWSTLEDTRKWVPLSDNRMPTLQGKYKVPHFDAKGEADIFFTGLGIPTTLLLTAFFWENFLGSGLTPKVGPDGRLSITFPMGDKKLPSIASGDIGKCVYGIFKRGTEFINKKVGLSGGHLTGAEMAATLGRAIGREVIYTDVDPDVYRGFGFPGADELGNMFQMNRDFSNEYCAARSIELSRTLNPELLSFEQWAQLNKDKIPVQ
jgi:uncharacterized protein YbjT (DUF2867 family)